MFGSKDFLALVLTRIDLKSKTRMAKEMQVGLGDRKCRTTYTSHNPSVLALTATSKLARKAGFEHVVGA